MRRSHLLVLLVVAAVLLAAIVGVLLAGDAAVVRSAFYLAFVAFVVGLLWIVNPPR
jgi:hypothetical protein